MKSVAAWRKRVRDSYGMVTATGFDALDEMDQNYRRIDETTLQAITADYRADYAVLYAQTNTHRPVLYANPTYKIVSLGESSGANP